MIENEKKLKGLLSICNKAGLLVVGEAGCEKAIRGKKAKLILLATDSSLNTLKKFKNSSIYYKIPHYIVLSKEELGKLFGKTVCASIVILDEGFKKSIEKIIENT